MSGASFSNLGVRGTFVMACSTFRPCGSLVFVGLRSSGKRVDFLQLASVALSACKVMMCLQVCWGYAVLFALINVSLLLNYLFVNVSPVKGVLK